jgi:outer membrane protein OmpA-like peptidoglycan-associated protein
MISSKMGRRGFLPSILGLCFFLGVSAQANVLGNMQTLAPSPDSLFFQNVHSSITLQKNRFNLGLFLAFVRNELTTYDDLTSPRYVHYKDYAIASDFIAAWGVTNRFQLTLAIPMFLKQEPDDDQTRLHFIENGVNTYRPGFKYNLVRFAERSGLGFVGSVDVPVSTNDPYVGTDPKPIYNLELAYDFSRGRSMYGVNVGYRIRQAGGVPAENNYFFPLRDQFIYSFAYAYGIGGPRRFHAELIGAQPIDYQPHATDEHVRVLEALLGYKQRIHGGWWGHVGATAEVIPRGMAPDYRVYAGVNWFFDLFGKEKARDDMRPESPVQEAPVASADAGVGGDNFPELLVEPASVELFEGGSRSFKVHGGRAPYRYRLSRPFGFFSTATTVYEAPPRVGEVELIVLDSLDQEVRVPIRVVAVPKPSRDLVIQNLRFVFNTTRLTPQSEVVLRENLASLRGVNIDRMIVAGHTDSIGSDEYNLRLSRDRAQAVAEKLSQQLGLSMDRIQAIGYGESRPITSNATDTGRSRNRRVELKLYYKN